MDNLDLANARELMQRISNLKENELHVVVQCIPSEMLIEELKYRMNTLEKNYKELNKVGNSVIVDSNGINWRQNL